MASLTEHAENIKAAIKAAVADGIEIQVDLTWYDGGVEKIEVDLWEDLQWETVLTEDRT